MFHSAGYFKSTLCPFHEHGLCHRPHCHYSHKKKPPRSSIKKPPFLRHRPHPSSNQGQSSSGHSSTNIGYDLSKIDEKVLSDVAVAIGQVSNFFGSSKEDKHHKLATVGKGSPHKEATSDSSKDVPSYAPEKLMETYAETDTGSSPNTVLPFEYTLASYTPAQTDASNKASSLELEDVAGKASSLEEVTVEALPSSPTGKASSHQQSTATLVSEPMNPKPSTSEKAADINQDTSMTEEDIFGSSVEDYSPDNLHGDDGSYYGYNDEMTESTADIVPMETKVSVRDLSQIEAEFKKVTALPDNVEEKKDTSQKQKKRKAEDDPYGGLVRKKWKAHSDSQVVRESARVAPKTATVNTNFSEMLSGTSLFMGKKRTAVAKEEGSKLAVTRPKLSLTVNAKIPTQLRQKFLDALIDEHLKMTLDPGSSYETGLREEKELFDKSSMRMIYMNHCTSALKKLREKSKHFITHQRAKSNARVKSHTKSSSSEDQLKVKRSAPSSSNPESKKHGQVQSVVASSKVWSDLETELQARFSGKPSEDTRTTKVCSGSLTSKKNSLSNVRDDPKKDRTQHPNTKANAKAVKKQPPGDSTSPQTSVGTDQVIKTSTFYSKSKLNTSADSARKNETSHGKQTHSEKQTQSLKDKPGPLQETTGDLESELFGDSDSDDDVPIITSVQRCTPSTVAQASNTKSESTCGVSLKEQPRLRQTSSSLRPASPFLDSNIDFIRVFGSDSSDEDVEQTFESALTSLESLKPSKSQTSLKKKTKPAKKGKRSRPGKSKTVKKKNKKKSTHGSKESGARDKPRLSSANRLDVIEIDHPPSDQDTAVGSLQRGREFISSPSSPFAKVPMLNLMRAISVARPPSSSCSSPVVKPSPDISVARHPSSSCSSPVVKPSPDITSALLSPVRTSPPPPDNSSVNLVDMDNDVVFHVDDLCTQLEEQTCHSSTKTTSTRRLRSRSTRRSRSRSTSSQPSTSTAFTPSFLPSGPFINLTKVAAKQKQKITDMVSHAREKGSKTVKGVSQGGEKVGVAKERPFTILKKKEIVMTPSLFYKYMCSYLLTEEQLSDNGYPRPTSELGVASIDRGDATPPDIQPVRSNAKRHRCCRCQKQFIIYNDGKYQTVEGCIHHYGRLVKSKEYGEGVVSKYTCCQGRRGSDGCQWAKMHVTSGESPTRESGYVATQTSDLSQRNQCVYAVDCEMCYTTVGLQLTRVSVIDMKLEVVYESLVKPSHPIVDYNTRFSGLKAEDFVSVTTTLSDVQQHMLDLVSSDTILIGHSLESDLRSLKVIHSSVVDTALVFPHKKGLPYKRALKSLMLDHLQKFIQNDIDGGHDSLEDSRSCMELMLWKVKGDLKIAARRTSDSTI